MLHVAPEPVFDAMLRKITGLIYITADLSDARAMERIDVMHIPHPDGSFDVIYCSHVLEHVRSDSRAIRELHRVLEPDGWVVLQVPIIGERTYEDLSVKSPASRRRMFGHPDHVRRYGTDFKDRLEDAGFRVDVVSAEEIVGLEDHHRMGMPTRRRVFGETVYFCTKSHSIDQSVRDENAG
jgi:SAM-dependent methyltransferase